MDEETKARKIDLYIKENIFLSETNGSNLKRTEKMYFPIKQPTKPVS